MLRPVPRAQDGYDPYGAIPALYDAEYGDLTVDGVFFARQGSAERLLVLGCGTGRICRLLETTRPVVGLDRSPAMLDHARRRARGLRPAGPPDDRPAVEPGGTLYVEGTMVEFDLGSFGEVIAPNAALAFLQTRRERQECLTAVHRALPDGGVMWLDLPMPDFARLGERHTPEALAWQGQLDGEDVRRTRETSREPELGQMTLLDRYYRGDDRIAESRLTLHMWSEAELEWAIEGSGFYIDEVFGGYTDERPRAGSARILVRAVRG